MMLDNLLHILKLIFLGMVGEILSEECGELLGYRKFGANCQKANYPFFSISADTF